MPFADADAADRRLIQIVDAALAEGGRRSGAWLACRVGCTECCLGPFPINMLDARRLARGLAGLAARDAERAARIRERARQAVAELAADFPGDPATGILREDEKAEERFCERHAALPCPALDPDSGGCELYAARPLSCRSYGPPVRLGAEALPPCRLCYQGASQAEVEDCRVEIDPEGVEFAALEELEAAGAPRGQTLIAFALAGRDT
ncbi:MAG TPA: YkgJ family cysteine cluster protein [Bryobacteraceae bacterium]|nr:YkgJ family cysteine cluster protein [Bryobacteraceae bacterium]